MEYFALCILLWYQEHRAMEGFRSLQKIPYLYWTLICIMSLKSLVSVNKLGTVKCFVKFYTILLLRLSLNIFYLNSVDQNVRRNYNLKLF